MKFISHRNVSFYKQWTVIYGQGKCPILTSFMQSLLKNTEVHLPVISDEHSISGTFLDKFISKLFHRKKFYLMFCEYISIIIRNVMR